jgi:hypothetical protein
MNAAQLVEYFSSTYMWIYMHIYKHVPIYIIIGIVEDLYT